MKKLLLILISIVVFIIVLAVLWNAATAPMPSVGPPGPKPPPAHGAMLVPTDANLAAKDGLTVAFSGTDQRSYTLKAPASQFTIKSVSFFLWGRFAGTTGNPSQFYATVGSCTRTWQLLPTWTNLTAGGYAAGCSGKAWAWSDLASMRIGVSCDPSAQCLADYAGVVVA